MDAANLTARRFDIYPPQARCLAVRHLDLLRRLPPVLAPLLGSRIIDVDDKDRVVGSGELSQISHM